MVLFTKTFNKEMLIVDMIGSVKIAKVTNKIIGCLGVHYSMVRLHLLVKSVL